MAQRKPGVDTERRRGAIRALLGGVPLPIRGRPMWDTFVAVVREADQESNRYSEGEKARIHTARLLIDGKHQTQKMDPYTAKQISIALVEFHEATKAVYDPKKVDDEWRN